jgi:exo-1,4-beta-D-glucosaminidase
VQYSYDDRSIAVVNDRQEAFSGLTVSAHVYDLALKQVFSRDQRIDVAADAVARAFTVPVPEAGSTIYFLKLSLADDSSTVLSTNFYWLSTKPDVLDEAGTKWYYTPTSRHADLTDLAKLPPTELAVSRRDAADAETPASIVTVENTGKALAFQVHLKLVDASTGEELLPVYWEANYFELMPGEQRAVRVSSPRRGAARTLAVEADAWNVPRTVAR